MTAPTLPDRTLHLATSVEVAPDRLSTAGWSRLRRSVTVAVFTIATVAAVTIGVRAVDVSPVAPPAAIGQGALSVTVEPLAPAVAPPTAPAEGQPTPPAGNGAGRQPGVDRGQGRGRTGGGPTGGRR